MKTRFKDTGEWLYQFTDLFLVRCPRCDKCARVVLKEPPPQGSGYADMVFAPRRLVCPSCGYTGEWQGKEVGATEIATDFYFHLPLWIQTTCCSETLWAFNARHLDFLEAYVSAELREGQGHGTVASKLPRWLMSAKNRNEVLRCIGRLRERAEPACTSEKEKNKA